MEGKWVSPYYRLVKTAVDVRDVKKLKYHYDNYNNCWWVVGYCKSRGDQFINVRHNTEEEAEKMFDKILDRMEKYEMQR